MRIIRRGRRLLGGLALAFFLGMTACGSTSSGSDYLILVHVTGAPADTALISATAKNGDTYAKQAADIAPPYPLDVFSVKLPAALSGRISIEVSALGSDECKSATGSVVVDLSQGRGQEVSVNLSALNPRRCSLVLTQSGEGTVTPSPAGTPCGTGCYDYNQNDSVVLKFDPSGKSYGAQTYVAAGTAANGVCDGLNDCSVKLTRRVQVDAKFQPRLCSASKWCWYHPLPQGNALNSIWGSSQSDIWAVGDAGTAMHFDGQSWSLQDPGTAANLNGVWTGSVGTAVVVGDSGSILRWNGSAFTKETSPTTSHLNSVWGSSTSDVYAVGDTGTIIHNSGGSSWTTQPSNAGTNNLARVFGSGPQNVWAVGQAGTVLSMTGSTWTKSMHPTLSVLRDVYTSGVNDVWVAAGTTSLDCGTSRWDGSTWKTNNICSQGISALAGSGPMDVWTGSGTKFMTRYTTGDPTRPTTVDSLGTSLLGISNVPTFVSAWSAAPGDVYFTTLDGNVVRRVADPGGTQLTGPLPNMTSVGATSQLVAIGGSPASMYLFYDDGTTYVSDGKRLTPIKTKPSRTLVFDAYTAPTGEVFLAGNNGYVERYNAAAGTWTLLKASGSTSDLTSVGGSSANNFWAGTSAGFIYYYANQVAPTSAVNVSAYSGSIWSIWGRTDTDGWAVGAAGTVVRLNKGTLTNQTVTLAGSTTLYAVAGPPSPSAHVWIAGQNGLLLRSPDGVSWTKIATGITYDLFSIVALSETNVWISGRAGVLFHWDGTTLKQIIGQFGTRQLTKLYSPAANDLWLVGGGNAVWRYMP